MIYHGPPPSKLLKRSEVCGIHVNDDNAWNGSSIQFIPLKNRLEGGTDGDIRLNFIKSMLNWVPERRKMVARTSQPLEAVMIKSGIWLERA